MIHGLFGTFAIIQKYRWKCLFLIHRSGKDTVDHPLHSHDDIANAVCGALVLLIKHYNLELVFDDEVPFDEEQFIREHIKEEGGVWFPGKKRVTSFGQIDGPKSLGFFERLVSATRVEEGVTRTVSSDSSGTVERACMISLPLDRAAAAL